MVSLIGANDANLRAIEAAFPSVNITVRSNEITLRGPHIDCLAIEKLFAEMTLVIRSGQSLTVDAVARSIAMLGQEPAESPAEVLSLNIVSNRGRTIRPKTANQKRYVDAIEDNTITFGIGPAGTGKSYCAAAIAADALQSGQIERIILTRPAVEAGENLGFLPGDVDEKFAVYIEAFRDCLNERLGSGAVDYFLRHGRIVAAPLAFMRGKTFGADSFVILDEAQNTSVAQMKMFLTRLGKGSRMVITGDRTQIDLPRGVPSGLADAERLLSKIPKVSFNYFTSKDVVRHPLVAAIIEAYEADEPHNQST